MSDKTSDAYRLVSFTSADGKRMFIPLHRFISLTDDPGNAGLWSLSYLYGDKLLYNVLNADEARSVFDQLTDPANCPPRFQ